MKKKTVTAFCCHNALYSGMDPDEAYKAYAKDVHIIETPCSGKVDPIYMLKAFEKGADCVVVMACDPKQCAMLEGSKRIHKRIEKTKALLAEAGIEPERLILQVVKRPALKNVDKIFNDVIKNIKKLGPSPIN